MGTVPDLRFRMRIHIWSIPPACKGTGTLYSVQTPVRTNPLSHSAAGTVETDPEEILTWGSMADGEPFFSMCLVFLRSPFFALCSTARLVKKT